MDKHHNALVVEGGAMRVIFANGVLDTFMQAEFNPFDLLIGVSAGASSIGAYLAQMYKRNYLLLTRFSTQPEFISVKKFMLGKHMVDLDWFWGVAMKGLHLDYDTLFAQQKDFWIGMTHMECGKTHYVQAQPDNLELCLKATGALPFLYRDWIEVNGEKMVDGSIADSIPVQAAIARGATRIMVLRSRPRSFRMKTTLEVKATASRLKKYPALRQTLLDRAEHYNATLDFIRRPPPGIEILEINPPEDFKTRQLTQDFDILQTDYVKAREIGLDAIKQWG